MCLPAGRSAINTRPRSINAAATTRSRGFTVKLLDSLEHPVAVLEFFATAARTGRIAADLRRGARGTLLGLLHRRGGRCAGARRLSLRLRRLLASGAQLRERRRFGVLSLQRTIQAFTARLFLALDLLGALHLNIERREDRDRVELDAIEHRGEQLERFTLVLVAIIFLRVTAQMDALA